MEFPRIVNDRIYKTYEARIEKEVKECEIPQQDRKSVV